MFEDLSNKLESVFKQLRGQGKLTEKNIKDGLRDVRRALLESDVNYKVAKDFIKRVEERAVGEEVLRSLKPGEYVVRYVHEELINLLGGKFQDIQVAPQPPTIVMVCGLQGSGKTTLCGKFARYFRKKGKHPFLIAGDIYRPAAIHQLQVIGKQLDIPVFSIEGEKDAVTICRKGLAEAKRLGHDFVIIDTAGRLQIDEAMMAEVERIKHEIQPTEIVFVADAMIGQEAVNVAKAFHDRLAFDSVALTKMDGDARGGAALSIRAVTGKPIKYIGVGEKMDALEPFNPEGMASRILGMGDVLALIDKVQSEVDLEKAKKMEEKILKQTFTLEDFLEQLQEIRKLGPLDQLLKMVPGADKMMKGASMDERELSRVEAIIRSMTPQERRHPRIIKGSRRKRIAKGSGTTVREVNRLLEDFRQMQKMMKKMGAMQRKGKALGKMMNMKIR
ncbi:MAG: signal recognition particle protein [Gemmatimonadetes bacterium]|nr:MAG: signal recognition particle protein [Gemmatimonadota bacterium]